MACTSRSEELPILTPKLQLDLVIPKNVGRFQDGLELSLLVTHIQALKIRQERLNRSRQTLRSGDPGPLFLDPEG